MTHSVFGSLLTGGVGCYTLGYKLACKAEWGTVNRLLLEAVENRKLGVAKDF